ncbi:MAG TPA: type VI secretion lipoprotein TssJ [Gammaproteobacteria bacterium]
MNAMSFDILVRSCAAAALLALCACAGRQELTIAPEAWVYQDDALVLAIQPAEELNVFNGRAHALNVGIFQMADPNPFIGFAGTRDGALSLLSLGKAADPSILDFRMVTVQPGKKHFITLARPETAQYVGVIFGYYGLTPSSAARLMAYPVVAKPSGFIKKSLVFLQLVADEAQAKPGRLWLRVHLGPRGLLEVKPIVQEEDMADFGEEAAALAEAAEESGLFDDFKQSMKDKATGAAEEAATGSEKTESAK